MKQILFIFLISLSISLNAQVSILNADTPEEIGMVSEAQKANDNDHPLSYGYVADKDVLWQRTVWELIDLDERVNFPLLYPLDDGDTGKDRKSLYTVLTEAVKSGEVPTYRDSYFNAKDDLSTVEQRFIAYFLADDIATPLMTQNGINRVEGKLNYFVSNDDLPDPNVFGPERYVMYSPMDVDTQLGIEGFDAYVTDNGGSYSINDEGLNILKQNRLAFVDQEVFNGVFITDVGIAYGFADEWAVAYDSRKVLGSNLKGYSIRGVWYFDARQGELRYRIIAIAPVGKDVNATDQSLDEGGVDLFWIYYPDVRQILHDAKAYNSGNSARPISFDHLLNSRRFSAIITKTDNVYGDRKVESYIRDDSMMRLLEAQRLKEDIRNFELEMWNN